MGIAVGILVLNAFVVGGWAAKKSQRRAKEVTEVDGSIKITAGGVLNTTVYVYDSNGIANAGFDYDLVEDHRDALRQLGFSAVHVDTVTGQSLDRPL
jgi:hypothetical protein